MFDEAYMQILGSQNDDDLLLIRTISKLGCKFTNLLTQCFLGFMVQSISETIRTELFKRALVMID
jgi:hypothetical protein